MKVSNLPSQITQPFKTLAPAVRCGFARNSVDTENFDAFGNPNGNISSGKQVGNTYANQQHNFIPCFTSHNEFIEHIFQLKYVEVSYDFTANWTDSLNNQQQQSYQGSWRLWIGEPDQSNNIAEADYETYLPHERCCLRYIDQNGNTKRYSTEKYSSDSSLYLTNTNSYYEPNFFLYAVDLYQEDFYTLNSFGHYERDFKDFIGRFYSPDLLELADFSTSTGEILSMRPGYAPFNSETLSIPCYHVINGTSYEGRVYLYDISGYSVFMSVTGSFSVTHHNYNYNIPS